MFIALNAWAAKVQHSKLYSMTRLQLALCLFLLTILATSGHGAPAAEARGKKEKKDTPRQELNKQDRQNTPSNDTGSSLDKLLQAPVEPAADKAAAQTPPAKLEGSVEATDHSATGTGGSLQGSADDTGAGKALKSGLQSEGAGMTLTPKTAPAPRPMLKGSASTLSGQANDGGDPDASDRELMVEWDRWRNKFLRAVQLQVQASVNHPDEWEEDNRARVVFDPYTGQQIIQPRFPMGTEAWFTCEVTKDRRIKNLSIIRSSGQSAYDKAVIEGVRALEGTSMLEYPNGSKRLIVGQTAGIRTSETSDYKYHHFGDVERTRQ